MIDTECKLSLDIKLEIERMKNVALERARELMGVDLVSDIEVRLTDGWLDDTWQESTKVS